jgi:hypothetical protein
MVFIGLFIRMNFGDHVSDHDAVMTPGLGFCHRHWQWFNVQHGFQMPGTLILATHYNKLLIYRRSVNFPSRVVISYHDKNRQQV